MLLEKKSMLIIFIINYLTILCVSGIDADELNINFYNFFIVAQNRIEVFNMNVILIKETHTRTDPQKDIAGDVNLPVLRYSK